MENEKFHKYFFVPYLTDAGWPKGWAVFNLAKEVWKEETSAEDAKAAHASKMLFPIGEPNDGFAQFFIGQSYLAPVSGD